MAGISVILVRMDGTGLSQHLQPQVLAYFVQIKFQVVQVVEQEEPVENARPDYTSLQIMMNAYPQFNTV